MNSLKGSIGFPGSSYGPNPLISRRSEPPALFVSLNPSVSILTETDPPDVVAGAVRMQQTAIAAMRVGIAARGTDRDPLKAMAYSSSIVDTAD
jgi:hypothetical protein